MLTAPLYLTADATADRNGEETVHAEQIDHAGCPGDNGGADPNYVPTPKDCGVRTGIFKTKLYFFDNSEDGSLFVPISTYVNCPFHLKDSYEDDAGHFYLSSSKLSEKQLFDKKRKKFLVSGDHINKRSGGETSGPDDPRLEPASHSREVTAVHLPA